MNKWGWATVVAISIGSFFIYTGYFYQPVPKDELVALPQEDTLALYVPTKHFGIVIDSLQIIESRIKRNEFLSDILAPYNVPYDKIHDLSKLSKKIFDVRKFGAGKAYTILFKEDSLKKATHFIYQPNAIDYVVIDFSDSVTMYAASKQIEIRERELLGEINTSLYIDLLASGGNADLVDRLVDVFAWQVDFFGIQKGDNYKIIFSEKYVDGEAVGIDQIKAAYFEHVGESFYGFHYDQGKGSDYFDSTGQNLRREFLKAPLSFTRISSRYTGRRYHPVQKRYKAHRGTDYAAPRGTPIKAAADGKIIAAKYHRFNGNFVKIQHNGNIATQYLHMNKIASGIRYGKKVKRGQIIGFVGSTGLASGPHLCYRFWKNGVQVDAMNVKLPPSEPILKPYQLDFDSISQYYKEKLDVMGVEVPKDTVRNTGMFY